MGNIDWSNVSPIESEDMLRVTLTVVASEHDVALLTHTHHLHREAEVVRGGSEGAQILT